MESLSTFRWWCTLHAIRIFHVNEFFFPVICALYLNPRAPYASLPLSFALYALFSFVSFCSLLSSTLNHHPRESHRTVACAHLVVTVIHSNYKCNQSATMPVGTDCLHLSLQRTDFHVHGFLQLRARTFSFLIFFDNEQKQSGCERRATSYQHTPNNEQ